MFCRDNYISASLPAAVCLLTGVEGLDAALTAYRIQLGWRYGAAMRRLQFTAYRLGEGPTMAGPKGGDGRYAGGGC
ncbi:MAG: hypothetical protein K6F94_01445 [Bacteroidaceae bacterium]|nr:hypothetical protein [Bacteroidaceae bacterium]